MTTIYEKFGQRVKKIRNEKGLSQEELAHKIKMDARTIVAIETGKRNPTLLTISRIAKALDVSLDRLLPN